MEPHVVLVLTKEEQNDLYQLVIAALLWLTDATRLPAYQGLAKKLLNAQPGIAGAASGIIS